MRGYYTVECRDCGSAVTVIEANDIEIEHYICDQCGEIDSDTLISGYVCTYDGFCPSGN